MIPASPVTGWMELPRFTQEMDKRAIDVQLDAASQRAEAERARRQDEWLKRRATR